MASNKLKKLKHLFWFADLNKLDFKKNRNLVVHQVLAYGTMDDIRLLFGIYPKSEIKKEFLDPKKGKGLYNPAIFELCKLLVGIEETDYLDRKKYIKKVYEDIS
jgi:hypothetical protein